MAKRRDSSPWITPEIKKLIRKRDRLQNVYKCKKKSGDKKSTEKFKIIKRKVQRELRRAYWKYVEEIVTPQEDGNQYSGMKCFWTYIKHKSTDNKGIAPMRNNRLFHSEPSEQATILNNQFQSAFSEKCNYMKQEFQNKCHMVESYQIVQVYSNYYRS